MTKTHAPGEHRVGDRVEFTLEVTNHGPAHASDVVLTDTPGAGLVDLEVVESTGWTIGTPVADEAVRLLHDADTDEAFPSVDNIATVATTTTETTQEDNSSSDTVTVVGPDLVVTKSTETTRVTAGGQVTYRIEVSNRGTSHAEGVTVIDRLPDDLRATAVDGDSRWRCDVSTDGGGTIECVLSGALAAGECAGPDGDDASRRRRHPGRAGQPRVGDQPGRARDPGGQR